MTTIKFVNQGATITTQSLRVLIYTVAIARPTRNPYKNCTTLKCMIPKQNAEIMTAIFRHTRGSTARIRSPVIDQFLQNRNTDAICKDLGQKTARIKRGIRPGIAGRISHQRRMGNDEI